MSSLINEFKDKNIRDQKYINHFLSKNHPFRVGIKWRVINSFVKINNNKIKL